MQVKPTSQSTSLSLGVFRLLARPRLVSGALAALGNPFIPWSTDRDLDGSHSDNTNNCVLLQCDSSEVGGTSHNIPGNSVAVDRLGRGYFTGNLRALGKEEIQRHYKLGIWESQSRRQR